MENPVRIRLSLIFTLAAGAGVFTPLLQAQVMQAQVMQAQVMQAQVMQAQVIQAPVMQAQSLADPADAASTSSAIPSAPEATYARPTETMKVRNYFFDAYGPFPIVGSAIVAGINQYDNSPPEWRQDAEGYAKRFGSDFGIAAVTTTTRYALAEVFREDTLYYRCECKGFFRRFRHATISTFTSRRGSDGHTVFSVPSLVAPYVGTTVAVYAWYPDRYNEKDAFRMGNYSLLGYIGANLALEFFYSGPHSFWNRMHLNNPHGALGTDSNH